MKARERRLAGAAPIFIASMSALARMTDSSSTSREVRKVPNNGHSLRFALAIRQLALCLTKKHNFISPKDDRKRGSSDNKQSQRHQAQRFRNLEYFGSESVGPEAEETCPADSPGHVEEEKATRRHAICASKQGRKHS